MLFRILNKNDLPALFTLVAEKHTVVGPIETGKDLQGKPIYAFEPVPDFSALRLEYDTTKLPAKRFFLPFKETMATFRMENGDWQKNVTYNGEGPVALFGMHACDINALNKLDKVLLRSLYPMPYYAAKRKNLFIVGVGCEPRPSCFCRSMGADTALHGFDLFLTDLGDRYFVEILSAGAYDLVKSLPTAAPVETDHVAYMHVVSAKNSRFTAHVDTTDLTKILDMEFQSPVWKEWGDKCLGCGSCASVCPTCYCYGVEEQAETSLRGASKVKTLYSCNLIDFAEVAGGHNFRPERHSRLKYRFYHKHRGFVEAYEEPLCVGCGRCGDVCLAGITVPEVIASVRGEEGAKWTPAHRSTT